MAVTQGSPDSLSLSDILGRKPTTNNSDLLEDSMSSDDSMSDDPSSPDPLDFHACRDDALAILAKVDQRREGKPTTGMDKQALVTQHLTNQVRKIQQTSSLIPIPTPATATRSDSSVRTQSGLKAIMQKFSDA